MPDAKYVDRPPRIQPELPTSEVEIPAPPKEDEEQTPLWQAGVPIVTIIGYVLVSGTGGSSNVTFLIPMAMAVFISMGITVYNTVNKWQRQRAKREAYSRKLVEMRREMVASHNLQRTFYEYNYPEPALVLEMNGSHVDNRGGTRLWERRAKDEDFGAVRLGRGTRKSTVIYKAARADNEGNRLAQDAERLAADSRYVSDVPLTIKLYQHPEDKSKKNAPPKKKEQGKDDKETPVTTETIKHTLGISGDPKDVYEFIYPMVAHYAAFHTPTDLNLFVLGMHSTADHWAWMYELPHTQINPAKGQYRLYFEDRERILSPITGRIEELLVKPGKLVKPGQVVARVRGHDGRLVDVTSVTGGRVGGYGLADVPIGENAPILDVGREVKAGMLICRLEDFDLPLQNLEEELDPRKGMQGKMGKARKRDVAGVPRYWKEKIWTELDRRARRLRDKDENDRTDITLPFMLIVVDMLATRPDLPDDQNPLKQSWLDDLESEAAISLLMEQGAQLGAAIILLVPSRAKIPSGCTSLIELKRDGDGTLKFLYAETGLNTTRYVGTADTIINPDNRPNRKLFRFARAMSEWDVRRSYGADIPRAVGLLSLYDANTINGLEIKERWRESKDPRRAEWPKIPLGMLAGQEPRYLHFFADADGVHGMIAGSTGSGKSELLMTLILSLAVKYDPMMVNFVLVDFKGGAAFDPFKGLPHVVDIVTNLRGNAVARMFAAINAELNRRQQINQDNGTKDIIRYRKNNLHNTRDDNYPFLFIIIDEFAEMIANNPEYKAQLDSITRLGRALGVSLILAAQRPTGVTDQMRANIKFRIALRVETREESSELLRLPDAAYLPSIPGRGYLQVGSNSLEMIQVGYTGEAYNRPDYDIFERYTTRSIIWEEDLGKEEDEPMYDVMVRRMAQMAEEIYKGAPRWRKPWPNPLPTYIALDQPNGIEVEYLLDDDEDFIRADLEPGEPFVLAPAVRRWMSGQQTTWKEIDWETRAMRAPVGLIDDPSNAKLHTLKVDFTLGHYAIFSGSGWGKSTFLRTVVTALVATHAPDDLHLYFLDFGSRSLQIFEELPHTGAYIVAHERERVERLLRLVEQTIDERKELLSQANVANVYQYNQQGARRRRSDLPRKLPIILVVVDNFAEFKDSYEDQLDVFNSLTREGQANGVHFILSGEMTNAIGKLLNLIPERITLKLSDDNEYASIVGKGAHPVDEIPGRGLRRVDRSPLELQVAMPLGLIDDEEAKTESERLLEFVSKLKEAGKEFTRPPQIDILETWSTLPTLLKEQEEADKIAAQNGHLPARIIIGRADSDLRPMIITLDQKPHFIVTGAPSSGKTTTLQTWILSLAEQYSPQQVALIMIDYQNGIVDYGGTHKLDELPHAIVPCVTEPAQLEEVIENLENEFLRVPDRPPREIYVIIDNYDDFDELAKETSSNSPRKRLGDLARRFGKQGLHFVICGMRQSLGSSDEFVRPIAANRYGYATDVDTAESSPFYAAVPRSLSQMQLPRGRGLVVTPGKVALVQAAVPYLDPAHKTEYLDEWVRSIKRRGEPKAVWLPMVEKPKTEPDEHADGATPPFAGAAASQPIKLTPEQRAAVLKKLAERMELEVEELEPMFASYSDADLMATVAGYDITLETLEASDEDARPLHDPAPEA